MELRACRLQHDEVAQARDDVLLAAVDRDDGGAGLLSRAHPAVVVVDSVGPDGDALPGVLLDLDAGALDRLDVADEVAGEGEREVLDLADAFLLRVRVDGLLLRVGRQDARLVADQMGVGEVAAKRRRDVEVANLMASRVAVDPHDAVLGLPILVRA